MGFALLNYTLGVGGHSLACHTLGKSYTGEVRIVPCWAWNPGRKVDGVGLRD